MMTVARILHPLVRAEGAHVGWPHDTRLIRCDAVTLRLRHGTKPRGHWGRSMACVALKQTKQSKWQAARTSPVHGIAAVL